MKSEELLTAVAAVALQLSSELFQMKIRLSLCLQIEVGDFD